MPSATQPTSTNFEFLREHEETLVLLAVQAERLFPVDAVASIATLRLFAELLAQEVAAHVGLFTTRDEPQHDLLRKLRHRGAIGGQADQAFHAIRKAGNAAIHRNVGDHGAALHCLKLARSLAIWFHRSIGKKHSFSIGKKHSFDPPPFVPPRPPTDATAALRAELQQLRAALTSAQEAAEAACVAAEAAERARLSAEERARIEAEERAAAEALMGEVAEREAELAAHLAALQTQANAAPAEVEETVATAGAESAVLDLDEPGTRRLIDEQLRTAGWEADSQTLRWSKGTRPQKGKNLAIAEWPTDAGPADYVLFAGLIPVAVVEAKRANKNVSAALQQSARYARGFRAIPGLSLPGPFPDAERAPFVVPFLFATNGRPYLKQVAEASGVWFRDARRPQNLATPLAGWYTPEGLLGLLGQDIDEANKKLEDEPTDYLGLRNYQLRAIRAVEASIADGARTALPALIAKAFRGELVDRQSEAPPPVLSAAP